MHSTLKENDKDSIIAQNIRFLFDTFKRHNKPFLSCWHMNEEESAAMWKLHSYPTQVFQFNLALADLKLVLWARLVKPMNCFYFS